MVMNKNYKEIQGHECLSACVGGLLGFYNKDVTPNSIILLGNGGIIKYSETEDIMTTNMYAANFKFFDRYDIQYKVRKVENGSDFQSVDFQLREEVNKRNTPILKLVSNHLPYSRVFSQAQNATHYICLIGYDEADYYILDNYVPSSIPATYSGKIEKLNLIKCLSDGSYIIVEDIIGNIDIGKDLVNSVINYIDFYMQGGKDEYFQYGQDAALNFFKVVGNRGARNTVSKLLDYNFQLKVYGFISLKSIFINIFSKLTSKISCIQAQSCIEKYKQIIGEWYNISMYMLKCGHTKKDENYQKLIERVIMCNGKEIDLLSEMRNICKEIFVKIGERPK